MKNMFSTKRISSTFLALLLLLSYILNASITASAQETAQDKAAESSVKESVKEKIASTEASTLEQFSNKLFGNIDIKSSEYLYNLDGSADYLYVEFKNGGYAIFLKNTMELMEHSAQGRLPYSPSESLKYYGGPGLYLLKDNESFVNTISGEHLCITDTDARAYAMQVREMIKDAPNNEASISSSLVTEGNLVDLTNLDDDNNIIVSGGTPTYDRDNLITMTDGTYIPNYRYFLSEPLHGKNENDTCGAVAAQLMLSYHNYYSDRRIIDNKYLNGDSSVYIQANPNYCTDPMIMSPNTLGTRGYYADGRDDPNSYFSYVVENVPGNATVSQLKNGLNNILSERNNEANVTIDYTINSESSILLFPVESDGIINELDSGRPVIVLMRSELGGTNHYVVAYGYNNYKYPNSSVSYLGYITHFGWKTDLNGSYLNVWVNSSWCRSYITLNINHTHNYRTENEILLTNRTEYKCSICGHRTDAVIRTYATNRYIERVATLPHPMTGYTYQEYYVTFETAGNKLFQTFGNKDAMLFLYDTDYNLLASNNDAGYNNNALFNYTVQSGKPYILRVKFYSNNETGDVKIGITPASFVYTPYEDIWTSTSSSTMFHFESTLNTTRVLTFTPTESGTYSFATNYTGDTPVDSYLYVVDPVLTNECLYDDDSGGNLQALITMDLVQGKRYFIVVSTYNITTMAGFQVLNITKIS